MTYGIGAFNIIFCYLSNILLNFFNFIIVIKKITIFVIKLCINSNYLISFLYQ